MMLSKKIAEHLNALESPNEAAFYTSEELVMKRPFFISFLQKNMALIICPIVRICATKPPDQL